MFEAADFGEETVVQDGDVRLLEAGRSEYVNDPFVGDDGFGYQLADGGLHVLRRTGTGGGAFDERGLDGLEERYVVAEFDGGIGGGAEGEGFG